MSTRRLLDATGAYAITLGILAAAIEAITRPA